MAKVNCQLILIVASYIGHLSKIKAILKVQVDFRNNFIYQNALNWTSEPSSNVSKIGSWKENEVAGFIVFSQ